MRTSTKLVSVFSIGLLPALGAVASCSNNNSGGSDAGDSGPVKKEAGSVDGASDAPVTCTASSSYSTVTNEAATFTPTPTDGGVDAAVADAAADAADDGSSDAGVEGGADAGGADAGSADAGSVGGSQDFYTYQGDLNTDVDILDIQLYTGFGVFKNGIAPGTYTLAGDELNYATCGLCVLIDTNSNGSSFADQYLATGGTVTITALQPTLTGTLTNVTLTHVSIDQNTFQSMPVGDGCNSSIPSLSISASVTIQ